MAAAGHTKLPAKTDKKLEQASNPPHDDEDDDGRVRNELGEKRGESRICGDFE